LAWHEGWRAPPGPTSRMTDARTEPRGGPRAASRPLQFSAIHPRRRRHPRDTCRRHLNFSRGEKTRRRDARDRGGSRDLATTRSPVDDLRRHRPDPFEWQRERAPAHTVVSVTSFAPFAVLSCTGRGAMTRKKSRRLSAKERRDEWRDESDLAPTRGTFCAKTKRASISAFRASAARFVSFSVWIFFQALPSICSTLRASPLSLPRPQRTPRSGPG
jgi:hypothetical protein